MPEFVEAITRADVRWEESPVVVGHSLAGLIIPHVAKERRSRLLVFVCAMIAPTTEQEKMAFADLANPVFFERQKFTADGRGYCTPEVAEWAFFHDAPDDLRRWAASKLVPVSPRIYQEMTLLDSFPDVPSRAIITRDDHMVADTERLREHIRQRLGIDPLELPGSHSPFLSHPAHLARILNDLAKIAS